MRRLHGCGYRGITSACAEQTTPLQTRTVCTWDHLRVCGADHLGLILVMEKLGSPPRVRSRRRLAVAHAGGTGITSACAEQTAYAAGIPAKPRDHLRVCGADEQEPYDTAIITGSPPRVRSRLQKFRVDDLAERITSACAEQTMTEDKRKRHRWDHLRVCGADPPSFSILAAGVGSPPRVRSRLIVPAHVPYRRGITSACAEQTT